MKVDLWSSARGKKGLIDLAQKWYILPAVSALEGKVAEQATYLDQPRRVLILGVNVTIFYVAYVISSGQWAPTGAGETVWFWSAVSMWLLSLLAAPWFTPPRDAFAAAISAGVLLATTDLSQVAALAILLDVFRWAALGLAGVVLVSALAAMLLRNREPRSVFGEVCYKLSESLGRGEVMFTPPALVSISAFYQGSTGAALVLMALWVFFTVVQPRRSHGSHLAPLACPSACGFGCARSWYDPACRSPEHHQGGAEVGTGLAQRHIRCHPR
jgi:hypothetical protein